MNTRANYFLPEVLTRISRLELRARHVVEGFVSGMHRSPFNGRSVEFAGYRPYAPGDDLRHLDWRAFGKADRYFVKEYEEETNMRVQLLLDCSGSMAYPERPVPDRMPKWDYVATLAVSLAHLLLRRQDSVGLTLFDHKVRRRLPASSSMAALATLTAAIEQAAPQNDTKVTPVFDELPARLPRRGMVVIVSDLLTDVADVTRGLQRLRFDGHDVLVLQVLDRDELTFPFVQRTRFEGLENGPPATTIDPQALKRSYLEAMESFTTKIRAACVNNRVDYALISTADPVDVALTTFLATRMRRQRAE